MDVLSAAVVYKTNLSLLLIVPEPERFFVNHAGLGVNISVLCLFELLHGGMHRVGRGSSGPELN